MTTPTLDALAARLQQLEDRVAIYELIAAYGPAVDACEVEQNAALWTEDCVYEVGGLGDYPGHEGLRQMIDGPFHQDVTQHGSGHVNSLPHILLDDDRAVATGYSTLFGHRDGAFRLVRLVASRWEFERREGQWKIRRRTNRLLDGAPEARALLARANRLD